MRRPGDNVSNEDLLEKDPRRQKENPITVMFGGCGYGAGSFNQSISKKQPRFDLLSFLGFRRKKPQKK
jgi:hypothetical protein